MAKYRVLSVDGGGLKGLMTVKMLEQLSNDSQITDWLNVASVPPKSCINCAHIWPH